MFAGIDGIARKVTGAHIGVDGVARRAKKLYMGVDGKARLCWEADGGESDRVRAYLYNGVKLPDINSVYTPELQKTHPYAVIVKGRTRYLSKDEGLNANYDGSEYELVVTDKPLTFSESVGTIWYNINDNAYDTAATGMYSYLKKDGEMVVPPVWNNTTNTFYEVSGIPVWSNYTLTNETDLTLPTPSDPVPLCSYNGVELPELPKLAYPYALMFYFDASAYVSGTTIAKLYLFDKEAHYVGLMKFSGVNTVVRYDLVSDIKLAEYAGLANIAETITQANVWTYNKTETYAEDDSFRTPTTSYIIWSNYDVVKSSDGSIISTASDPVPVYI